jgi:hypothetical protein
MKERIILDLCGGTGSWSEPYRKAGYTVHNITLPEFDVRKAHLDLVARLHIVFPYEKPLNDGKLRVVALEIPISRIHGILAAPPCTEFSVAKTTKPRDFIKGMETVSACLQIVWLVRARNNALAFWALENPTGLLRYFLGNPPYSFRQWWFGNDRSKPTDLWGRFNTPRRTRYVPPASLQRTNNGVRKRDGKPLKHRNAAWYANATPAQRAITPPEFARAFFKANP